MKPAEGQGSEQNRLLREKHARQVLKRFEQALSDGQKPRIEDFLKAIPPQAVAGNEIDSADDTSREGPLASDTVHQQALLVQLLQVEIESRGRRGELFSIDEYLDRFPSVALSSHGLERLREAYSRFVATGASGPNPNQARGEPTAISQEIGTGSRLFSDLRRGATLGNYTILEKIGAGGMGAVFRAEHRRMLRDVALKVLSPNVVATPEVVQRFHREVRVAAKLSHPNIVAAFDADEDQGIHFLAMELVEGTTLAALVKESGSLPVLKAVDYIVQSARGLGFAHSKGIVHRDIKPGNLMLDRFGIVKLLDLGLARLAETGPIAGDLTDTGHLMGTADYMSPEQALNSKHADHRSDIYSLGCTFWFLLTGKPVYGGATFLERILAHRDLPIPSLRKVRNDVTTELDAVFRQMVAKSPDDRYQTIDIVLAAFEQCHLGANESSYGGYTLVAPVTDEIPLAEPPVDAEPGNARASVPMAGNARGIEPKLRQIRPAERKPTKSLSSASKTPAAIDPSRFRRRLTIAGAAVASLIVAGGIIASIFGLFGRAGAPQAENANLQEPPRGPAVAKAPFSADEARSIQKECALLIARPVERSNSISMKLVLIPPGEFDMGTPETEIEQLQNSTTDETWKVRYGSETLRLRVPIAKAFYLSACEVTQAEFEQVTETNPSLFSPVGNGNSQVGADSRRHPVEQVTWLDAVEFCNRLSKREGLTPCYELTDDNVAVVAGNGYRLPTEEEWEYACRAGTTGRFTGSDADPRAFAWYDVNSGHATHPVGELKANAFGLFDVHGNVREWCQSTSTSNNQDYRVQRGGSWDDLAANCRSAVRIDGPAELRYGTVGFRVVVSP